MDVSLRPDRGANIFGMLEDLHFPKFLTVCRDPTKQFMASVTAILYPATFLMIEVEPSNLVRRLECRRKGRHQCSEGRGSDRKVINKST